MEWRCKYFYLSAFTIATFSFSLFICKTKRKKLITLLQHVEKNHIFVLVNELASYGQTLLLGLV